LILAAQLRFRRLIGVEIVPALADIARANLARLGVAAEVHTADAARFVFPPGPVVLFLFNPFKAATIGAVIEALRAASSPELVVIYHAPDHSEVAGGQAWRSGVARGRLRPGRFSSGRSPDEISIEDARIIGSYHPGLARESPRRRRVRRRSPPWPAPA
jgi:hypothetical protein